MKRKTRSLCLIGICAFTAILCTTAEAKKFLGRFLREAEAKQEANANEAQDAEAKAKKNNDKDMELAETREKLLWGLASLPIAALLAAVIAYHPIRVRSLGVKKEQWETPKALVIIAVAGVVVGTLVNIKEIMAFALFGFGSFIRFRTPVKNPKETAIIFFVAGLGCMCGFQQFEFAVASTAFLFVLIWFLDRGTSGNLERITLILKGLGTESQIAAKGYKERLEAGGVEVVSSKVSLRKGHVTLLLNKEIRVTTDDIEEIIFRDDDLPRPRSVEWIKG